MEKKKLQVQFALRGIKSEQFAIFDDCYAPTGEADLSTEFQFKLDQENKQIGVFAGFEFLQEKKAFLKILVSCHFKIEETSWGNLVQKTSSQLVIPKGFLAHLAMITTGTARGVLFAKTESTIYSTFIVPTLNVEEMITEDASFDLEFK